MANRNLTIDRQNKAIVPYSGSLAALAPFYQTNTETFQIRVVDPSGDSFAPWTVVDYAGAAGLRFQISSQATGTLGDDDDFYLAKTVQGGWTWNSAAGAKYWTGSVSFNTDEIETYLGDAPEKHVLLEITVVTAGLSITIFRSEVLLRANVDEGSSTPTTIADAAAFVQVALIDGANGITINENLVSVTGLTWPNAPVTVLLWIDLPDGTVTQLLPNLLRSTLSATGFSFVMNTAPDNDDYKLNYIPIF